MNFDISIGSWLGFFIAMDTTDWNSFSSADGMTGNIVVMHQGLEEGLETGSFSFTRGLPTASPEAVLKHAEVSDCPWLTSRISTPRIGYLDGQTDHPVMQL